ncbi:hypothetical protein FACS189423_11720 [Bacteroidia bacterium]|nr:hypothetical protein FACS189423_11720 [Bacteroidia bacterium]
MKKIIYKIKLAALLILVFGVSTAHSQAQGDSSTERTVNGRVIDSSTKQGFAGVRISVLNTKLTTMSDEKGAFEITVPDFEVTFSVDAPGYQTQIVPLKGRKEVAIALLHQTGAAAFYDGTEFSTAGINSVSDFSDNILTIDEDLTARLGGQVRSVIHSGTPAAGSAVFARGFNSLNATAQPLYVVDGIVWQVHEGNGSMNKGFYNNPLAVIDPKDVEKITVLKGGSSIYGSKGANGVILIDTKRSRSQATAITVDLGIGYRSPFQSIPVMDGIYYLLYVSDIIGGKSMDVNAVDKYKFL